MSFSNQPKLSPRAQKALDILADGGVIVNALETNSFTGREQFKTRFQNDCGEVVKGLGAKTRYELEDAGFQFKAVYSLSTLTHYALSHAG